MTLSPALSSLKRSMDISQWPVEIAGTTSPVFLSWLISQENQPSMPKLVVCANEKSALRFCDDLVCFDPTMEPILLRAFDESPYSGLYPSNDVHKSRMNFVWRASRAESTDIFVSSVEALLQKTIPHDLFKQFELEVKRGE